MCPSSWMLLPPSSPFYSSGLSQCTGFKCPVSYIELELVIYFTYGNIHVSMLFSQIIPPSLSPTDQKVCSFICVSFAVPHIGSSLSSFQIPYICVQFSSVQPLSCVLLFATLWITAHQASLSITNSRNLLTLMSFESVMPSSHLILCRPLLYPPIPPSIRVYTTQYICVNILYWGFSFWLTSLYIIGSSFIYLIRTDSNVFFLIAE